MNPERPSITIFGESRNSFIKIERICHGSYDLSQNLAVSIAQDDFCGTVSVWVDEGKFDSFIRQLRRCENTRRGEALLHSMSPDEFMLKIFNTHSKGNFALTCTISSGTGDLSRQLRCGFSIDPSLLRQILSDFETLYHIENRYRQG